MLNLTNLPVAEVRDVDAGLKQVKFENGWVLSIGTQPYSELGYRRHYCDDDSAEIAVFDAEDRWATRAITGGDGDDPAGDIIEYCPLRAINEIAARVASF